MPTGHFVFWHSSVRYIQPMHSARTCQPAKDTSFRMYHVTLCCEYMCHITPPPPQKKEEKEKKKRTKKNSINRMRLNSRYHWLNSKYRFHNSCHLYFLFTLTVTSEKQARFSGNCTRVHVCYKWPTQKQYTSSTHIHWFSLHAAHDITVSISSSSLHTYI